MTSPIDDLIFEYRLAESRGDLERSHTLLQAIEKIRMEEVLESFRKPGELFVHMCTADEILRDKR